MSLWTRLRDLLIGNRERPLTDNGRHAVARTPRRTLSGDMLVAIARSLLPGGGGPQSILIDVPVGENPGDYWVTRDRCSVILDVVRRRPKSCAPVLAACLRHDGFDEASIRRSIALIAPHITLPRQLPVADLDYLDRELEYARDPGYEQTVALANAISQYSSTQAIQLAEQARTASSDRPEALIALGWLYLKCKNPESAAAIYQDLVSRCGREEFRVEWVRSLNESKRFDEAIRVVDSAPAQSADLIVQKSRAFRALPNAEEALKALKSVDTDDISDQNAFIVDKGECEYELRQYLQAIKTVATAFRSQYMPAVRLTGLAYAKEKEWAQAVTVLRQYVAITTDDAEAWRALGESLYALGDYAAALQAAREANQLLPEDSLSASLLAQALVANRQYEEAADFCARSAIPGILPQESAAVLLLETRQLELASQVIQNWVHTNPRNVQAWMAFGWLDELMNDLDNALAHYHQVLRIKPDHRPALEALRRVSFLIENQDQGADDNSEAARITIGSPR